MVKQVDQKVRLPSINYRNDAHNTTLSQTVPLPIISESRTIMKDMQMTQHEIFEIDHNFAEQISEERKKYGSMLPKHGVYFMPDK